MQASDTHLLYVYCIVPAQEAKAVEAVPVHGMDGEACEMVQYRELAAVLCRLHSNEYNPEALELKMSDHRWVTSNATNHHEVIACVNAQCPTLPLPFCTLFSTIEKLYEVIDERYEAINSTLTFLADKEAWNVKIHCREDVIRELIKKDLGETMQNLTPGKQFIMMKKRSQIINDQVEQEQEKFVSSLHEQLEKLASAVRIQKNWKPSENEEETMVFNCTYLVPVSDTEGFFNTLAEFKEQNIKDNEWIAALSGPWPPYHFGEMDHE